jgi:hypothetical protein
MAHMVPRGTFWAKSEMMFTIDLSRFTLIRVSSIMDDVEAISQRAGCYLFLIRGGTHILRTSSYFEMGGERPFSYRGFQHVYTGASQRGLRERLKQHTRRGHLENSSLRMTLLTLEFIMQAVSTSETPYCKVCGQVSLSKWLSENAVVAYRITKHGFEIERAILRNYASPFNVDHRRDRPYSQALMRWRAQVFPPDRPERRYALLNK